MGSSFINLTRGNEIGANSYYLEFDGEGIVLDAGMHPKLDGYAALPDFSKIDGRKVEAAFVSHAHHDHIGSLPLLMRRHPDARVFMHGGTRELAAPLLCNSVTVMKRQRKEREIEEYPLYVHADVKRATERWEARPLLQKWQSGKRRLFSKKRSVSFQFHDAGHILGSAAVEIEHGDRRILYTGDINLADQTIMKAARLPEEGVDTLIVETTRGQHPMEHRREVVVENLLQAIRDTFQQGGAVLIPVFAMGKTQEALTLLHQARERGDLPRGPIYIGGLSRAFTEVYDRVIHGVRMMEDIRPEM
ncbi:MAG: MBL fold metallo-hydrolase, partial [bacterium]